MFNFFFFLNKCSLFSHFFQLLSAVMWTFTTIILTKSFFPQLYNFIDFSAFVYANNRLLWAFAMSWVIFHCHYGSESFLKRFFSLKIWMPVEKMGLSLYLIHGFFTVGSVISKRSPVDFDVETVVRSF